MLNLKIRRKQQPTGLEPTTSQLQDLCSTAVLRTTASTDLWKIPNFKNVFISGLIFFARRKTFFPVTPRKL